MRCRFLASAATSVVIAGSATAQPSHQSVLSCLSAYSTSPGVSLQDLPTTEIDTERSYSGSYDATFLIRSATGDVGYAVKEEIGAIIHRKKLYPLATARPLKNSALPPDEFNPFTADWSTVQEARHKYLCVSFPFGALGSSGQHQQIRAGFMLSLASKTLYYAVANTAAEN